MEHVNKRTFDKLVPRTVVADEAEEIARMRSLLTSDSPALIDNDGTITLPDSSSRPGESDKIVPKTTVANEADEIARMRSLLTSDSPALIDNDGTITLPDSSSRPGENDKIVPKTTVAAEQWYNTNRRLLEAEIAAMEDFIPNPRQRKRGFLEDGKMYWQVAVGPKVAGRQRTWVLLMVYDSDHPQVRWGGSVKVYPVSPNINEMQQLVNNSRITPKTIPHLLSGPGGLYMCSAHTSDVHAGEQITSAAQCLRFAMRWINVFELGLRDQKTWTLFNGHGQI
ncbi:MAG: hypothetical protein LBN99_08765 [Oscillospiraceae bacterium]|nr:hypothetical protein [Oscillospiraceae bacterium]